MHVGFRKSDHCMHVLQTVQSGKGTCLVFCKRQLMHVLHDTLQCTGRCIFTAVRLGRTSQISPKTGNNGNNGNNMCADSSLCCVAQRRRRGSQDVEVSLEVEVDNQPERHTLSASLSAVLGLKQATRASVLHALWAYIKANRLQVCTLPTSCGPTQDPHPCLSVYQATYQPTYQPTYQATYLHAFLPKFHPLMFLRSSLIVYLSTYLHASSPRHIPACAFTFINPT